MASAQPVTSPVAVDNPIDTATLDDKSIEKRPSADIKEAAPSTHDKHERSGWFHWHEPGTSKEEKRLIFKLDFFLLTFSCLTYFVKQVSSSLYMSHLHTNGGSLIKTMSPMPMSAAWPMISVLDPATSSLG